ncbi:MAG: hypothetical protein WA945_02700, partial [Arcobacteraceae bacterium]
MNKKSLYKELGYISIILAILITCIILFFPSAQIVIETHIRSIQNTTSSLNYLVIFLFLLAVFLFILSYLD